MKKIDKLKEITMKYETRDPLLVKLIVDKINEIIDELNKKEK
jgi:hypothetical protein